MRPARKPGDKGCAEMGRTLGVGSVAWLSVRPRRVVEVNFDQSCDRREEEGKCRHGY
jgi:hypothetical protein